MTEIKLLIENFLKEIDYTGGIELTKDSIENENKIKFMACSDYPIALGNYSSIDEIIQTDDFEETIKDYRELAKQRINFNSLSERDCGMND